MYRIESKSENRNDRESEHSTLILYGKHNEAPYFDVNFSIYNKKRPNPYKVFIALLVSDKEKGGGENHLQHRPMVLPWSSCFVPAIQIN